MALRRLALALPLLMALALVPLVAAPAVAAVPVLTTTTITSIDPPSPGYVGQTVTMKVKVTAADGSVPQGTVSWDDAGACFTDVASAPVGADGTATLTYAFPTAYSAYSMNACFRATDSTVYQDSEDFGATYDARTVPTTTTITSIDPPHGSPVGTPVTMKVKVTAADGSVPQGTVSWDDAGACFTDVASAPVGADGTVTLTYAFPAAYPSYSMNACFRATDDKVYQDSEDFGPTYDAGPVATTTTITSITPPGGATVGQTVTMKVKVTAADGSVPQGTVSWDDAGACFTDVASAPVGPDGTVTLTYAFPTPYPTYSMNACFRATDSAVYRSSEDFGPFYPVQAAPPPAPPAVTRQPRSTTAVVDEHVTFTADASGTPSPGVQWQRSSDGGHTWANVAGATSRSLSVTARATGNGDLYRAVFANPSGSARTAPAALLVTDTFLGYTAPSVGAKVKRGKTVPVTFRLADASGHPLADAVAAKVPTVVQLWSGKPALSASASCGYVASGHQFRCALKVPSTAAAGTYHLAALTRLGNGPWVLADPSSTAHNPQTLTVTP